MDPERMARLEGLFHRAVDLPRAERPGFLDRECAGDADLRRRLAAMLTDDDRGEQGPLEAQVRIAGESDICLEPGARVGPFQIERTIGAGGMGTVYEATAQQPVAILEPGARVALKVLHRHLTAHPGFRGRFRREAKAGRRVMHENVVRTLHSGESGDVRYLAMEHVEGRTLRELLADLGAVPETLVREIAAQVAAGLAAIHSAGLVHRDLKPENVLITGNHEVRIMDLGVSHWLDESVELTREGQFLGSLLYAAPEQLGDGGIGPAADLYSLGATLYELVVGENPFRRSRVQAVVKAQLEDVPAPAHEQNAEVSRFLSELLAALLMKDPGRRIGSADLLGEIVAEGENSVWWTKREREIRETEARRPRVPVRRETALYGRDAELDRLRRAWQRAVKGEGNTVFLEGEAGIGKTRLIDAFLAEVDADATLLYGSYSPTGSARGLSDALLDRFGPGEVEEALRPLLHVTPGLVAAFAALLKHEAPPGGHGPLRAEALPTIFVHLMRSMAAKGPLMWIVEDLHFSDAHGRKIVLALARALREHRVLLLLTTRPGLPEDEIANFTCLESVRWASLGRLSPREVIQLLRDAFRSARLAEKLGGKIAYKSDGIPFFVFEMIRGLKEGQFIAELPDGSWIESQDIEEIEVPSAVRDLVEARLCDLPDADRSLLDAAAVLGYQFDPDLIARMKGLPRVEVLERLAAIERRSGVVCGEAGACRFDHHQIQEVVAEGLMPRLRAEYHDLMADAFAVREGALGAPPEDLPGATAQFLATHYLQGRKPHAARPFLRGALAHLEGCYRQDEVVRLVNLTVGVEGLLPSADQVDVLTRKGSALRMLGRRDLERTVIEQAVEIAQSAADPGLQAQAGHALGGLLLRVAPFEEVRRVFLDALEHARTAGDTKLEAALCCALGMLHRDRGQPGDVRQYLDVALGLAEGAADWRTVADVHIQTGLLLSDQGKYEEGRTHLDRAFDVANKSGDRWVEALVAEHIGWNDHHRGHYEEARISWVRHLEIAREVGDRRGEASATGNLGVLLMRQGRFEEAHARLERQLTVVRDMGDRQSESISLTNLGLLLVHWGRYDAAQAHLEQALGLNRELGNRQGETLVLGNLGSLHKAQGSHEEAKALLERQLALAAEVGLRQAEAFAAGQLGELSRDVGSYEESRIHLERSVAIAEEIGWREAVARGKGAQIDLCLAQGRLGEARSLLEHALPAARQSGVPDEEIGALASLAALSEYEGDLTQALRLILEAIALRRKTAQTEYLAPLLTTLGRVRTARGELKDAIVGLDEALAIAQESNAYAILPLVAARRATLPGGDIEAATAAIAEHEGRLALDGRMEARFLLWQATQQSEHLAEAHRILLDLHDRAPPAHRSSLLESIPLHRDILRSWGSL